MCRGGGLGFADRSDRKPVISDETIDRVRREARIVALVGERVTLTRDP